MVESRCGCLCSTCTYKAEGVCQGCTAIRKPFWGESCPLKACCEGKGHGHCGTCADFPCAQLTQFAYDKEQGDEGRRIEQCRLWREG